MTRNPRVYVTNDPGLSFDKAEVFGEVIKISQGPVNPFQPDVLKRAVYAALETFDARVDYLCPSGAALAVGFAFSYLSLYVEDESNTPVKLLLFNSKTREYFARSVEL